MLKKIFTKEMMTNALVTMTVVLVALAINEKFVKPRINGDAEVSPTPTPTPIASTDEDV